LNRGRDSRIGFDLLEDIGRGKEAAWMALSDDLRQRVVRTVVEGGMSRHAAGERFWGEHGQRGALVARFKAKGEFSPAPTGGERRSGRIEAATPSANGRSLRAADGRCAQIVLKNSEIGPPRKSRFRGRRVISADSPGGRAYRSVAHGKTGRSPREIFIEAASGLLNCDRYGNSSFSTQSTLSGH
jgi:hypothetical protein